MYGLDHQSELELGQYLPNTGQVGSRGETCSLTRFLSSNACIYLREGSSVCDEYRLSRRRPTTEILFIF